MSKAPPSFERRDALISIEHEVQKQWADVDINRIDAPSASEAKDQGKYFCTFPYPYMNGVLHLGHAFTLCKAEFQARYQRLLGKKVLFPFGFHCTGMPIAACADKLKNEVAQFGNPPQFPEDAPEPEPEVKSDPNPKSGGKKKKASKGKAAKKKSKLKYQWQIMKEMGLEEEIIHKFQDAKYWLEYFPPIARTDLKRLGVMVDFRRSFITTDVNPYYDSFIRWHFNTLRKEDKIAFGKRISVYSVTTKQPCADHDRASGEGVGPQEYTLIKLVLQAPFPEALKEYEGKKVVLPAATLRPETMYGQTNAWVLPDGEYGVYEMKSGEIFITSERSALNMAYQDLTHAEGELKRLGTVSGRSLLGCAVKGPLTKYEKIFLLPLLTIKMDKGTGVVTSVPSDAPDDYAALEDLRKKKAFREKFGITDEMVLPFETIPIIDIPGLGTSAAETLCKKMKVQSQNDRQKLDTIKEQVYMEGFYKGLMIVGEHKGKRVEDAKPLIKDMLVASGEAVIYSEPERKVVSRSGDECICALVDQWYLKYGEDEWRAKVRSHVENVLDTYNPVAKGMFVDIVDWLREWACSRSYGLGTLLPWDKQFVIESLSDSTIYMAYYTIAHFLQGGVLDGSQPGSANIKPEQLTDEVYDYVFKGAAYPADCGIEQATLDQLRNEFQFWYPMDLRVSGKDLIGNHLTMSIYNHAAVWKDEPEKWPRSFFTNGHLNLNANKMSKSTGNFLTLRDSIEKYGADVTRFGLADAGDGLIDANFDESLVNATILRLTKEQAWIRETLQASDLLSTDEFTFMDKVFDNDINKCIAEAKAAYDSLQYHEALRAGHFDLLNARDQYRASLGEQGMNKTLVLRYIKAFLLMLAPVCPHYCDSLWKEIGEKGSIVDARWPTAAAEDQVLSEKAAYLREVAHDLNSTLAKQNAPPKKKKGKKAAAAAPEEAKKPLNACDLYIATELPQWQQVIVDFMKEHFEKNGALPAPQAVKKVLQERKLIASKKDSGKFMQFAAERMKKGEKNPAAAFASQMVFDEMKLVQENSVAIFRGMDLVKINIYSVSDPNAPEYAKANQAAPGKPVPFFYHAEDETTDAVPAQPQACELSAPKQQTSTAAPQPHPAETETPSPIWSFARPALIAASVLASGLALYGALRRNPKRK